MSPRNVPVFSFVRFLTPLLFEREKPVRFLTTSTSSWGCLFCNYLHASGFCFLVRDLTFIL